MTEESRQANGRHLQRSERNRKLEAAFREHAPRIFEYARRRGSSRSEAEEIVSEVFLVLTRRLDEAPDELLPWLYGVARKLLANQARSRRRKFALIKRAEEQASGAAVMYGQPASPGEQDLPLVLEALSSLSERDQEALLLVAWEGLRYEEAARSLGCGRHAFAQRLSRARRRLLSRMGDVWTNTETVASMVRSEET